MKYEIDKDNAVQIFQDDSDVPFVFQPDWPNGTPWANKAEAEGWAKQTILALEDEAADWAGISPDQPTQKRPEPVEPQTIEVSRDELLAAEELVPTEETPAE
jgi:hypothetical protein